MNQRMVASILAGTFFIVTVGSHSVAGNRADLSPPSGEQQLPRAMRSAMENLPHITIGTQEADLIGSDHRALQAAVDYIWGLGGGVVDVREGQYMMYDSLHLRPNVTVRGTPGKTVLRKADAVVSPLGLDGDFGEEQITLQDPAGFAVGHGVAIWDNRAGGFHTTVARLTGQTGHTFSISNPLMADCMVNNGAQAATVFPVVSGYGAEHARIENLTIDGNRDRNVHLNGCRGAGIFLYRSHGAEILRCTVRHYNGDGISFQQSNDVTVTDCISERNTSLGIHPGSGSQRPMVRGCVARHNGTDGLFLCWRVRHGVFEDNVLEANERFGISIGHKDSDNLLRHNIARENKQNGVFFRNESAGMAPHRNRLEENTIENNGGAEIRIRGEVAGLVFARNVIRDLREEEPVGILVEERVGELDLQDNIIHTEVPVEDRRPSK